MPPRGGHMSRGFLTEEEKKNRPKITKDLLKRIFSYLKPYWKQQLLVLLCITISSVCSIFPSILTGKILDEGLICRILRALVLYILLSLGMTLGANMIGVAESYLNTWESDVPAYAEDEPEVFYIHQSGECDYPDDL